jgi:hypothetical protein
MGRVKTKRCYFQLSPMDLDNLPIEKGLINQNLFITQEGKIVDGSVKEFCKK